MGDRVGVIPAGGAHVAGRGAVGVVPDRLVAVGLTVRVVPVVAAHQRHAVLGVIERNAHVLASHQFIEEPVVLDVAAGDVVGQPDLHARAERHVRVRIVGHELRRRRILAVGVEPVVDALVAAAEVGCAQVVRHLSVDPVGPLLGGGERPGADAVPRRPQKVGPRGLPTRVAADVAVERLVHVGDGRSVGRVLVDVEVPDLVVHLPYRRDRRQGDHPRNQNELSQMLHAPSSLPCVGLECHSARPWPALMGRAVFVRSLCRLPRKTKGDARGPSLRESPLDTR